MRKNQCNWSLDDELKQHPEIEDAINSMAKDIATEIDEELLEQIKMIATITTKKDALLNLRHKEKFVRDHCASILREEND